MDTADLTELLEGLPFPAFVVSADERILAANMASSGIMGPTAVGRNIALAVRSPVLLEAIGKILQGASREEILVRHSDDRQFRVTLTPLRSRRALCVWRDMTAEMQSETIRRDFVANVSHELRTPLTALMGFIETLQGPAKEDAAARDRFLGIMEREAGRMIRLVRDLLQLSRVESEERVRPRNAIDLAAVLKAVAATVRPTADEKGSKIVIFGAEGEVPLIGDSDQLTQVFMNLIENAVKYGAQGEEVIVQVEVQSTGRKPNVRVSVKDKGEGIDAIHLPRLTERFYRVDSHRSRAEGGTGLGLAIVKHIVNRHRGQLKIESEIGKGSTFTVILPHE